MNKDEQFQDFPPISPALLSALERQMPERWPNVEMPDRSIWVRAGQHEVLELLRYIYRMQNSQVEEDHASD